MARTSKRAGREPSGRLETAVEPIWKAGIYARLSVAGNGREKESIDTQIAVAREYLGQIKDAELVGCYTDV